jgi:hypothetical protein
MNKLTKILLQVAVNKGKDNYQTRRSSIQVAELEYKDGLIFCDRDKPVQIQLQKPKDQ